VLGDPGPGDGGFVISCTSRLLEHRCGKPPAAISVVCELVHRCGSRGEEDGVPRTRGSSRESHCLAHYLTSLSRLDLEERNRWRVSLECRQHRRSLNADHDGRPQALAVSPHQFADVHPLEQTADHPHDGCERGQRRIGRVRVGRLRVVDPEHAVDGRNGL